MQKYEQKIRKNQQIIENISKNLKIIIINVNISLKHPLKFENISKNVKI